MKRISRLEPARGRIEGEQGKGKRKEGRILENIRAVERGILQGIGRSPRRMGEFPDNKKGVLGEWSRAGKKNIASLLLGVEKQRKARLGGLEAVPVCEGVEDRVGGKKAWRVQGASEDSQNPFGGEKTSLLPVRRETRYLSEGERVARSPGCRSLKRGR